MSTIQFSSSYSTKCTQLVFKESFTGIKGVHSTYDNICLIDVECFRIKVKKLQFHPLCPQQNFALFLAGAF